MATVALRDPAVGRDAASPERVPVARWLRTTPGLMRALSLAAVAGLALVALTGVAVLTVRRGAIESVGSSSGPQLVTATRLYAALSATDAAASSSLLRGGDDPPEIRARYEDQLAEIDRLLIDLADSAELSPAALEAARTVSTQLTTYAGRIEQARNYSRSGSLLGAAYVRTASTQMREEILPAATAIWSDAAVSLQEDYRTGRSWSGVVVFAVVGGIVLLGLVALGAFLAVRTRRAVNLGMLGATILLVAAVVGAIVLMAHQDDALSRAQADGSDPAQTLSAAYFLSLQAQADANLALADRDSRETYLQRFDDAVGRVVGVEGHGGLFDAARAMASGPERLDGHNGVERAEAAFSKYLDAAGLVRGYDASGRRDDALRVALDGSALSLATRAAVTNDSTESAITVFEDRFSSAADDARVGSSLVAAGLALAVAAAAGLVLLGVKPRIEEYR